MIEIQNSETLRRWLLESGHLAPLWDRPRFVFDPEEFARELAGVREQYPQFGDDEAHARAALRLMGKEEGRRRGGFRATGTPAHSTATRGWNSRERLLLAALVALAAFIALFLSVPRAHAQQLPSAARQEFRSALLHPSAAGIFGPARGPYLPAAGRPAGQYLQGGQPGGIIIQLASSGTVLATTPAGLLQFNCSTGMICSYAAGSGGNPPTFTLSSTGGGGGSGCIPPGTTANALLFDAGGGACSDVPKFTWNAGTSTLNLLSGGTLSLAAGGTFDPTAGTMKVPGTNGQLLFNNSGALGAEDPVVSGPDARSAAQTKNPVAGLAGIDYGTGCAGGPCVQEAKVDSSGNQYVSVTNTVPVSGTFWQSTQPVSLASLPALPAGSNDIGSVDQHGAWTVTANAGSGTFAVSSTQLPAALDGSGYLKVHEQGTPNVNIQSNATVNVAQIGGTAVAAANPCLANQPVALAINQSSSSTATIISGAASKHTYICSIFLISATAQNVNIVAGTGTNCGTTVHAGFFGGTTAATGPNLAANTGWTLGNGAAVVAGGTDTAADNVCLQSSGSGQISGVLTYVQQ